MLDKAIARTARNGKLELTDDQIAIGIGDLDPVEEKSGQLARLLNLGYYRRALDPVDEDEWKSAVEEFQCDHELTPVTGECDGATQAKLLEVHGC
nr:peptidoglycan-binding domain-containing protein [Aquabacterium terrae]